MDTQLLFRVNWRDVASFLGSRVGDTILDPFGGSGTTGLAASELGRKSILIELNPTYAQLGKERTRYGTQTRLEAVNS
jgi:DNA modification methylase